MIDIMINLINDKLLFSDLMLNLCWKFEENDNGISNILDSHLWKTIYLTCNQIIENQNEKDWQWLTTIMMPSTVCLSFQTSVYT